MQQSPHIDYMQLPHGIIDPFIPAGNRIVIVGESTMGELYKPTVISNINIAERVFGSGPLLDRYRDISLLTTTVIMLRMEKLQFEKAMTCLAVYPFDLVYFDELYFNRDFPLIQKFIDFAKDKETEGALVHGIFDLYKVDDYQNSYGQIKSLSVPIEDGIAETGKFVSVVADQVKDHKAGVIYAGLLALLQAEVSPVNKTLPVELKVEFSKNQILQMQASGIVCFKNSIKKGVVCTSSSCAVATEDSVHKHIANFRIAQTIIQTISEQLEKLVGKTGVDFQAAEAQAIMEQILLGEIQQGRIRDFRYALQTDQLQGNIFIEIELVPIFSVYAMTQTSQVKVRT